MPATETPSPTPELLHLLVGDPEELAAILSGMRAADVAEAINQLPDEAGARVLAGLPFDLAVEVLDQPELEHKGRIFEHIDKDAAAPLIEAMSADEQADLFREVPTSIRSRLMSALDAGTRHALEMLLRHAPETTGGIMTTEYVGVPSDWTVERTLRYIAEVGRVKETVYAIFIENPRDRRLEQVASLRDLMIAPRDRRVLDAVSRRVPLSVRPDTPREEAARIISKYNLLALPVLDERGHVLGIVTVDDVIDTMVQELTDDVQKFGGVEALDQPYMEIPFLSMVRKRAGWLCALFLGEMLTATAMGHFENEIAKAVVLALFVPLIISSGGNSGSQATSLVIRAMALHEVRLRDWWRVAARELPSGLTLGVILGFIGICRILLWQAIGWYDYGTHYPLVALTVGVALIGVVTFGSMAGSMLPFVLRRIGFDPASASAPFVATLVDVTGLVIYFSIAYVMLRGTLL